MFKIHLPILLLSAALCAAATPPAIRPASPSVPVATAPAAAPPTLDSVLDDLTADSFDVRQKAQENLHAAMARQILALTAASDPETSARLRAALGDQARLSEWVLDNIGLLGTREGTPVLRYALSPEVEPALRTALSANPKIRDDGIKALMALKGTNADHILTTLINDADSTRACTVIDALFDREPSDALSLALWSVVKKGLGNNPNGNSSQRIGFNGKHFTVPERWLQPEPQFTLMPAATLLAKYRSAVVGKALQAELPTLTRNNRNMQDDGYEAIFELAQAYKSDEVTKAVYELAIAPRTSASSSGNTYTSNRTPMIALTALLTDQIPADYGITKGTSWNPRAWSTTNQGTEEDAIKKLQEWWKNNKEKAMKK